MMSASRRRLLLENRIYIIFTVVVIAALALAPEIREVGVGWNVLAQSSIIGMVAVGLTLVILAGQLDLSVGSVVTLAGVIALGQQGTMGIWPAIGLAVLASVAVGVINGIIVVKAGVNSFIGTLATMIGVQGLAFVVSGGAPTVGIDPVFGALVDTAVIGPMTPRMLAFVAIALAAHFIVTRTAPGRNLLAVGGAPDVARLSGISSSAYQFGALVICATLAGVAGIVLGLSLNTGTPLAGQGILLPAVTAVLIGGTSLNGGAGSVMKTFAGVLLLGALGMGMNFQGFPIHVQSIVKGGLLLAVVLLDAFYSTRRSGLLGAVRLTPQTTASRE